MLLDSGAKVDAKPEHMVQSALMGSVYSELMFGVDKPRVGLLNIGEEETKKNSILTLSATLKAAILIKAPLMLLYATALWAMLF